MLQQQIKEELKNSMKARETTKTMVLKSLLSAFTNELVSQKRKPSEELNDEDILKVIKRAVKQRKDSIEQFKKGSRDDLAEKEKQELEILTSYLPEELSLGEIEKIAKLKKEDLGIEDKLKIGILIGAVMKETQGNADGNIVKEVIEKLFD